MRRLKIRDLFVKIGFDIDEKALTQADASLRNFKSSIHTTTSLIRGMTVALAASGAGLGFFLKKAGDFEQTTIAFETMLGSAEKAKALLKDLFEFAVKTPFQIPDLLRNTKLLLAMGIENEKVIETMTNLGNVASGLSVPIQRLALNFGQVKAQGKLTGRELRDFAIAGVPLLDELAKNLGKSKAEVADLVSKGDIGFAQVEAAFKSMASEGGRFADLMTKQSLTLLGMWSNLVDFFLILSKEIGGALLPGAKEMLQEFIKFMTVNRKLIKSRTVKFFKSVAKYVKLSAIWMKNIIAIVYNLTEAFGGLESIVKWTVIAFASLAGIQMLSALGSLVMLIFTMTKAVKGLRIGILLTNAAAAVIPILIGTALVALLLILEDIYGYFKGKDSITGIIVDAFQNKIQPVFDVFINAWESFLRGLEIYREIAKDIFSVVQNPLGALQSAGQGLLSLMAPSQAAVSSGGGSSSLIVDSPIQINVPEGTDTAEIGPVIRDSMEQFWNEKINPAFRFLEPQVE